MQSKLKQRLVGGGVLVLFLLPTLIMVIYHSASTPSMTASHALTVGHGQQVNQLAATDTTKVQTVQLQLPANQATGSPQTVSSSQTVNSTQVSAPSHAVVSSSAVVNMPVSVPPSTDQAPVGQQVAVSHQEVSGVNPVASPAPASLKPVKVDAQIQKISVSQKPMKINEKLAGQAQQPITATTRSNLQTQQVAHQPTVDAQPVALSQPRLQNQTQLIAAVPSKTQLIKKPKKRVKPASLTTRQRPQQPIIKASVGGVAVRQAWVVQVASFGQENNARMLLSKLRHAGFHAYLHQQSSSGKMMSQVFVGPEVKFKKMQLIQSQLKKQFHFNGLLRQHNL